MIIDLNSITHPQAEILNIDLRHETIDFRWVGAAYNGDCVIPVILTSLESATAEITAVLEAIIPV